MAKKNSIHWQDEDGWAHDDLTKREGSVGFAIEKYMKEIDAFDDVDRLETFL
jgi:hypothetical protein